MKKNVLKVVGIALVAAMFVGCADSVKVEDADKLVKSVAIAPSDLEASGATTPLVGDVSDMDGAVLTVVGSIMSSMSGLPALPGAGRSVTINEKDLEDSKAMAEKMEALEKEFAEFTDKLDHGEKATLNVSFKADEYTIPGIEMFANVTVKDVDATLKISGQDKSSADGKTVDVSFDGVAKVKGTASVKPGMLSGLSGIKNAVAKVDAGVGMNNVSVKGTATKKGEDIKVKGSMAASVGTSVGLSINSNGTGGKLVVTVAASGKLDDKTLNTMYGDDPEEFIKAIEDNIDYVVTAAFCMDDGSKPVSKTYKAEDLEALVAQFAD